MVVVTEKRRRFSWLKQWFGESAHIEPSRSEKANDYVWKDETAVEGTRFQLGEFPIQRGRNTDWNAVWSNAKSGDIENIPPDILCRYYGNIVRIRADFASPSAQVRTACVFWGHTGTGKSRRAWAEAGDDAFPKDPNTKVNYKT